MTFSNSLNINTSGVVVYDDTTGVFTQSTLTQYDTLVGGASNAVVSVGTGSAGQVLTSNGAAANPSYQNIPGSTWIDVTTGTQTIASNTNYVSDNATTITFTLPASPAFGATFRITGGASGAAATPWTIAQNAGQSINFGNLTTTVGVTGSLASSLQYDSVECVCVVGGASAVWTVLSSVGNLLVT